MLPPVQIKALPDMPLRDPDKEVFYKISPSQNLWTFHLCHDMVAAA